MSTGLCRKCGIVLDKWLRDQGLEYHAPCAPDALFASVDDTTDLYTQKLREDFTDIVLWAERGSERSQQKEVGASEVVVECWRRLGYRVAGIAEVNTNRDPWPAIVGTGIHMWLEKAFDKYERVHQVGRWHTEATVYPLPGMKSHTDLYDSEYFAVIDYKSKGTEDMREIRKGNIPADHIEQVHWYAAGHIAAGRRVDRVALIFVPRAGWLSGIHVWSAAYDPALTAAAVEKYQKVQAGVAYYKVGEDASNMQKFPATPGKGCAWCAWYNPEASTASAAGCPGK